MRFAPNGGSAPPPGIRLSPAVIPPGSAATPTVVAAARAAGEPSGIMRPRRRRDITLRWVASGKGEGRPIAAPISTPRPWN